MAEKNRNEMNAVVNVLGDVLMELQGMRKTFDTGFTQVLDKLTSMDN
jgi:hypothetical protein